MEDLDFIKEIGLGYVGWMDAVKKEQEKVQQKLKYLENKFSIVSNELILFNH